MHWTRRVGFGFSELGPSAADALIRVSLLIYYTEHVALTPTLAGAALGVGFCWDAILDPLIGRLSDYFHARGKGRRRLFLPGAFGAAFFLILLFNAPSGMLTWQKFLYLCSTYCLLSTSISMFTIPLVALAGELSTRGAMRNEIFAWRLLFVNLGMFFATSLQAFFATYTNDAWHTDGETSAVIAATILFCALQVYISTRNMEKLVVQKPQETSRANGHGIKAVLSNRAFLAPFSISVISTLGLTIHFCLAVYYYKYFLGLDDDLAYRILALFMFAFCASIPLWAYAVRRYRYDYIVGMNMVCLGLLSIFVYPILPAEHGEWPTLLAVIGGACVGSLILLEINVVNKVDEEQSRTGNKSLYGIYFGVWKMGSKGARALALIASGAILSLLGLEAGTALSPDLTRAVAFLFGPTVGILLLLSVFFMFLLQPKKI